MKRENIKWNDIDYALLGTRIKNVRQQCRYTQDELAEKVGCGTSHISNIENFHTMVSLGALFAIANALNTSIDFLLSDQYDNTDMALENEILRAVRNCSYEKKQKILKIIEII